MYTTTAAWMEVTGAKATITAPIAFRTAVWAHPPTALCKSIRYLNQEINGNLRKTKSWGHFGVTLGSFWGHFGVTLESFCDIDVEWQM